MFNLGVRGEQGEVGLVGLEGPRGPPGLRGKINLIIFNQLYIHFLNFR